MATIDLGKIKQVFRGTYNNATAYAVDDLVVFTDGSVTSTYICTTASTGNNPSSGGTAHANWAYVAKGVADPIPTQSGQSGKFLTTNGSALSFGEVSVGVSEIDHWIVNSNFNGAVAPISNNLVRYEQNGVTKLGTGMSVSSGTWTFPSTGFWRIIVHFQSIRNPAGHQCKYMQIRTNATTNNSSYEHIAIAENSYYDNYSASSRHGGGHSEVIFDCQNTSTHKLRFESVVQDNSNSGAEFSCSSTIFLTGFLFVKIAET